MTALAEQAWLADVCGGSVRDFFAHIGVDLGEGSGYEASVRCFSNPQQHKNDDRSKSCSVNLGTGLWKCHGCGQQGNPFQAAVALGHSELEARRLAKSYGLFMEREKQEKPKGGPRLPAEPQLIKWRKQMIESPHVMDRLKELKGWTRQAIVRLGLGWDGERVVFTVRDPSLKRIGIVRYLPNADRDKKKMLALPGSQRGLWPAPEIVGRQHTLFIVEGEPAAVSVWSCGLKAVAIPGSASWQRAWAKRLEGRRLIMLPDCDTAGRELAYRVKEHIPRLEVVDLDPGCSTGWDVGDMVFEAGVEGRGHVARMLERLAA